MVVKAIESVEEFDAIIKGDTPVVIDFWATWCGPCRTISPIFEAFSDKVDGVKFYKVDVDSQEAISQKLQIRANGNKAGDVVGAMPSALEELIAKGASLTK